MRASPQDHSVTTWSGISATSPIGKYLDLLQCCGWSVIPNSCRVKCLRPRRKDFLLSQPYLGTSTGIMKSKQDCILGACAFLLAGPGGILAAEKPGKATAPFPYVQARAWHVLTGTHSEQSGYFSLSEAHDGRVHIGTAKYGHNAYLVEFDPRTERQRIVIDAHRDLGLSDTGYAAQAKFHTRNFVGSSGKVYVGTKQGYPSAEDKKNKAQYAGGYVLTYDPRTGTIENLGMPYEKEGVIDVVADEQRGLIYVVTCENQHWMHYDLATKNYRELGPMLTPYATTLIDSQGRANVLTKDFQLAQYDPATGKVHTRPVILNGKAWTRGGGGSIPTWQLAADGRTAYLILMNDPTLLAIDLLSEGATVAAISHGKMIAGEGPDSPLRPDDRSRWAGLFPRPGQEQDRLWIRAIASPPPLRSHHQENHRPRCAGGGEPGIFRLCTRQEVDSRLPHSAGWNPDAPAPPHGPDRGSGRHSLRDHPVSVHSPQD